ncbi:uncharacterized protein RBU57_001766 isoform 1-T1 [Macrochelys suwanniensis]
MLMRSSSSPLLQAGDRLVHGAGMAISKASPSAAGILRVTGPEILVNMSTATSNDWSTSRTPSLASGGGNTRLTMGWLEPGEDTSPNLSAGRREVKRVENSQTGQRGQELRLPGSNLLQGQKLLENPSYQDLL